MDSEIPYVAQLTVLYPAGFVKRVDSTYISTYTFPEAEIVLEALPEIAAPEFSDDSCADSLAAKADGAIPTTAIMHAAKADVMSDLRM